MFYRRFWAGSPAEGAGVTRPLLALSALCVGLAAGACGGDKIAQPILPQVIAA